VTEPSQTEKPSLLDLCIAHGADDRMILQKIVQKDGIDIDVLQKMLTKKPVGRLAAEQILVAFSELLGVPFSLDRVEVELLPTFTEIASLHSLDLSNLAMHASVPYSIIDTLLVDEPVPIESARLVLEAISRLSGQNYTLDTVDVRLTEVQHG